MCRKNEIEILSGNSKKAHLKEIEQFYFIRKNKSGNGFSLKRRKTIKPKLDKRSEKIGKYTELIDAIVLYKTNRGFSGESMQIIRLEVFDDMYYIYRCSAQGGCRNEFKKTLGDELFDYIEREVISLIHRIFTSSIKRLQRTRIIEVNQYYELKERISTPEDFPMIEDIKASVLFENEIRNEYVLEALLKDSIRETIHREIKGRVFKELGVTIIRKLTDITILNKKAKIPNREQYKECCEALFSLMQECLIKRARKKYAEGTDEETMRMIEIFGETDIQKLEKFYIENIRY